MSSSDCAGEAGESMRNPLSAVSLFSGAGGMDVGFSDVGFEIVLANDVDPDACASYRLNHQGEMVEGSLLDIDFRKRIGTNSVDLVFGGPPCQGFSVAGKMDPDDERSRLIHSFFDVVDQLKPRAFVCENVKALAVLKKWEGVRKALFDRAIRDYRVALIVLSATDFGVPQIRERMFFVGVRSDAFTGSDNEFRSSLEAQLELKKRRPSTVSDIVRRLGRPGSKRNPRTCSAKITFAKSPILRKSPYAGMLFNGAGRPLSPRGWATTLPASMGGNKTPIVDDAEIFENQESFIEEYHRHLQSGGKPKVGEAPNRLRRLTIQECKLLQTFPESYRLAGSKSSQYRQLGNAVPPMLARAVASSLIEVMARSDAFGSKLAAE